ncbi:MAG: glutathione S-transferase family protein [Rhizobiaceae bacterium]
MPAIKLFEYAPTRSARPRWTLLEAGLEFESAGESPEIFGSSELASVHPLRKLPAAVIDGKPLFESVAICNAIADLVPDKNLIAQPGTWSRAVHDQWVMFNATEMEPWLWSNFLNTVLLPENKRVTACIGQNVGIFKKAAAVMNNVLAKTDYLVDDRFTVADIVVSYTLNGARKLGHLEEFASLRAYLDRLFAREHCTLDQA